MPSESGSAFTPPASNSERRLSNSSDGSSGSGYSKTIPSDTADFLATRPHTAAVIPGKPAANPLQFIKVGPADLGSRAREQLRKAELAKRTEPSRIEHQEDWQSNLDNWKSSRRKRVEHIIERCVEVRRMENEPNQPRGKSKTFNEMLEERAGRRRRNPLALYTDDESHDLSDLGIGTSSTKSSLSEDCDTHSLASDGMDLDKNISDADNFDLGNRKLGSSANEYDTCTTTSPEPEEYTYERAIEGYKSRIISQTNSSIVKTVVDNNSNKESSPDKLSCDLNRIRTSVSNKIEEKVTSLQQDKGDAKNNNAKKDLPKVDIHKRREQFERENSQESQINKPKLPEIANKMSIKDRMSSFEKFSEEAVKKKSIDDLNKITNEVKPLRERLTSLEKVSSGSIEFDKTKRLPNGDISSTKTFKERLSNFKTEKSEEDDKTSKTEIKEVTMSLKERLFFLDAAKNKDIPKVVSEIDKSEAKAVGEDSQNDAKSIQSLESQMQNFYRSLDSLDINGQTSPNSLERVQSLEDFDSDMQNNTVPSDIETEDSGIHTARDSCAPADDIADLTQVASPVGEPMIEVPEYDSPNEDSPLSPKIEEEINHERPSIIDDVIIEEIEEQDVTEDSESHYHQAVSQPEELSQTSEITELQLDKDEEDTLKSLENPDTSVSLNEPTSSSDDTVVFQGKMTIHLNLNEIRKGAGDIGCNDSTSNRNSMPMVTVSNITTTTNISPKNSIKSLKSSDSSSSLTNYAQTSEDDSASKVIETGLHHAKVNKTISFIGNANVNVINEHISPQLNDPISLSITNTTTNPHTPNEVLDALELAFKELDSEDRNGIEENLTMDNETDILESPKLTDKTAENQSIQTNEAKENINEVINSKDPENNKSVDEKSSSDKTDEVAPLYENIEVFYQNGGEVAFPLDLPAKVLEPPKEKPPPPPVEDVGTDELLGNGNFKHTSSARRIKKEIRNKRTSFLGIEGQDDSYLDVDIKLAPSRPDITSFLQEEKKIEKLLYKRALSQDMDSKLRDSRDSGVDVDRGSSVENWYKGLTPDGSNQHSRQNSEPYNTISSDVEDTKQRDIFTTNLNNKLSNLPHDQEEQAKSLTDDIKIDCLDKKIQEQQALSADWTDAGDDIDNNAKEVLRFERELLQLEQEELKRQRENLMRDQTRIIQKSQQDISQISEQPIANHQNITTNHRHSMPNLFANESLQNKSESFPPMGEPFSKTNDCYVTEKPKDRQPFREDNLKRKPFVSEEHMQRHFGVEESRRVLYDNGYVEKRQSHIARPPQPILPPRPRGESIEKEIVRNNRMSAPADYVNVDRSSVQYRQKQAQNTQNGQYHPMSRQALQQLSAAPTPKLISNSDWLQANNKKPNYKYNNQHWVIQEAEQRRLEDQRLKQRLPSQRHSYHQDMAPPPAHRMGNHSHSYQQLPQYTSPPPVPSLPQNKTHMPQAQVKLPHAQLNVPHPPQNMAHVQITAPHQPQNMPQSKMHAPIGPHVPINVPQSPPAVPPREEKILSVSGKRKCSHCGEELGRGAAMIIESLSLCYHVWCFSCSVCGCRLGDGRGGADVRVRRERLHCTHCYTNPQGINYSREYPARYQLVASFNNLPYV